MITYCHFAGPEVMALEAGSGKRLWAKKSLVVIMVVATLSNCGEPAGNQSKSPGAVNSPPAASRPSQVAPTAPGKLILSPVPASPPPLDDPQEVASELVAAEQAIRSESTPPASFARLGRVQQAAYRKLVANPEYRPVALAKAPASLKPVMQANIAAGEELRALSKPVDRLPAWKIVQPPPPEELRRYYEEAEARFGIPWAYLASIHLVETRMGRIRGTSPAGAQGPMQFIPGTWARYGEGDINDPRDAIFAAARYLKASGAPAAMNRALYAYNPSQRYVSAIQAYAKQMLENERTYLAFYHWQVYVRTKSGDVLLEIGYGQ